MVEPDISRAKRIPLTRDYEAIVDLEDWEWLTAWRWTVMVLRSGHVYAYRKQGAKSVLMHREIAGVTDPSIEVDHRFGNTLDNRRENIRVADHAKNSYNSRRRSDNTSGFKGVTRFRGQWRVRVHHGKREYHIGTFATAQEAGAAYNEAAKRLHGEFARLNDLG